MVTKQIVEQYLSCNGNGLVWKKLTPNTYRHELIGKRFGCHDDKGYRVGIFMGTKYKEHHLVWLLHYGTLPSQIDHINGIKDDNSINNLRLATHSQNQHNRTRSKNNTSGVKGVVRHKNKWCVRVFKNNKAYYGGYFDELNDAESAVVQLRLKLIGEFACD